MRTITIHWTVIAACIAFLVAPAVLGKEKDASPLQVIPLDAQNVAWITLTEKLEVVIAFKEPIEEIHSAIWKKAGDIDAALKLVELLQKPLIQSLEINTKDPLSIRDNQRCKVRCEIVGLRFAPAR
jgi:hypothetical protein